MPNCILALTQPTLGATYTVGDSAGWRFDDNNWPNGKSFKADDVLVFKYGRSSHNVAVVDRAGYDSCTASSGAQTYNSGNHQIALSQDQSYYICTFPGHCQNGMKIVINAS